MTKEEVEQAYKDDAFKMEYHSISIEIPTDRLEIEIVFPEGYAVQTFPGVFFGRTEQMHELELQRVNSGFERTNRGGRFTVNQPLFGFSYFIYWESPPRRVVDSLRQVG